MCKNFRKKSLERLWISYHIISCRRTPRLVAAFIMSKVKAKLVKIEGEPPDLDIHLKFYNKVPEEHCYEGTVASPV